MKTFTKVLLLVFWLLGAGAGFTAPDSSSADAPVHYRYAVTEGIDMSVQGRRVTVRIEHRAVPQAFALTVAVPSWVAAFSYRSERAMTASSDTVRPNDNS